MRARSAIVTQHQVLIGHETVRLRFRRHTDGFVLDRDCVERDGTTFTQTLPFSSRDALHAFFVADPHYEKLSGFIQDWMAEFLPER
jgi:hypothetical protein